jgi:HPt (histidine-containing phosphotransfer) domain-containing protein
MMNDEELICEIIELFLIDTPKKIEELKKAYADRSFDMLQSVSHSVKGTAANVCMTDIHSISFKLELAGKNKSFKGVEALLNELEEKFEFIKENFNS